MSEKFKKPNITINRVYTGKGDSGYTQLVGGKKVRKNSNRNYINQLLLIFRYDKN